MTKCQCPEYGRVAPHMRHMYEVGEYPAFEEHEPGQCECVNDIRQYRHKETGETSYLCSACCRSFHELVKDHK